MSNFTTNFDYVIRIIQKQLKGIITNSKKPTYHFYLDMVFGIMKSTSLILNDIAHSLNEEIQLKKLNYRLQRNLNNMVPVIYKHNLVKKGIEMSSNIFIVDDSEVIKPYGKMFEDLTTVRDGSSIKNSYEYGYLVTSIISISKKYHQPICLFTKVHSSKEKNYKSVNNITNEGLLLVISNLADYSSVFLFDRGYDDVKVMTLINDYKQYFIIRIRNNRLLKVKNRKEKIFTLAKKRKGKININIKLKGVEVTIKASHIEGYINGYKDRVTIVMSYILDSVEPVILITNKKISNKDDLKEIVLNYITRWKIEELFRFKKVEYNLENFRVKSLTSINNLMFILDIVILILAHIVETQNRNVVFNELIKLSKKTKENSIIKYYQLSTGIKTLFTRNKMGVKNYKKIERWESESRNLFNSLELKSKNRVRKKKI